MAEVSGTAARPPLRALLLVVLLAVPLTLPAAPDARAAAGGPGAAVVRPGAATASRWAPPLSGAVAVVRPFDGPARAWLPGHRGVDLAALPGQAVLAPAAGTVVFSGRVVDRTVVVLQHAGGLRTSLEPVQAPLPEGSQVRRGEEVARLADEAGRAGRHCPTGPCLHWGVRRGATYLDPVLLLGPPVPAPPPVLLPFAGLLPPGWGRAARGRLS